MYLFLARELDENLSKNYVYLKYQFVRVYIGLLEFKKHDHDKLNLDSCASFIVCIWKRH